MFSLLYEYSNLEYVHIYVIYRDAQAEYIIRIRMAASQEYVNTYSTCRVIALSSLAFTRYCHCQYCMLYGIHKWGRVGGRILRLSRAMVVQWVSNV